MSYEVKSADGVLQFVSLGDVDAALRNGLVAPDDQIRQHGGFDWKPVRAVPALTTTVTDKPPRRSYTVRLVVLAVFALAAIAWMVLGLLFRRG